MDSSPGFGVWELFWQSFDLFTVLLVLGSIVAVWIIVKCVLEIRPGTISSAKSTARIKSLIGQGNFGELRAFVERDRGLTAAVVREAIGQSARGRDAMREAAEVTASTECSRWFRKIEPLNVVGNLGPLVGLAGTVWGMILAFTTLGIEGGQAGPASLSIGISKALFHTLLGLMLAIPCLLVFGIYRQLVDKICTRAMADAARFIEQLPAEDTDAAPVEARKSA
ncbi:MAG: hypothetical protein DHS20C14_07650 [Phycisphaeraceae bacterium]|nr:MAG: hypothetical protein DHS20C14_07650 [Phycisphaeraceae bacterium]